MYICDVNNCVGFTQNVPIIFLIVARGRRASQTGFDYVHEKLSDTVGKVKKRFNETKKSFLGQIKTFRSQKTLWFLHHR
jgi:hypothetical protein